MVFAMMALSSAFPLLDEGHDDDYYVDYEYPYGGDGTLLPVIDSSRWEP